MCAADRLYREAIGRDISVRGENRPIFERYVSRWQAVYLVTFKSYFTVTTFAKMDKMACFKRDTRWVMVDGGPAAAKSLKKGNIINKHVYHVYSIHLPPIRSVM